MSEFGIKIKNIEASTLYEYNNNKITENIMKPENTTNRPVAELTVSKSSVSIEEGKSTSVTTKIRPNDAANKKLSWKNHTPGFLHHISYEILHGLGYVMCYGSVSLLFLFRLSYLLFSFLFIKLFISGHPFLM